MSEKESSQSSSNMDDGDNEEKELISSRNIEVRRVQNSSTDFGKNAYEQEVLLTERLRNEPYTSAANYRDGSGSSAELVDEETSRDYVINDHDLRTREAPAAHTASNQAQQFDTDRVIKSKVVNFVQGLKTLVLKEMSMSVNKIWEKVRTNEEDLR